MARETLDTLVSAELNAIALRHVGEPSAKIRESCPHCLKGAKDTALEVKVLRDGSVYVRCFRCDETGAAPSPRHKLNGSMRPRSSPPLRSSSSSPPPDHVTLWNSAIELDDDEPHDQPYLIRKKVHAHGGIRVDDDVLLVPLRNTNGALVGVQ